MKKQDPTVHAYHTEPGRMELSFRNDFGIDLPAKEVKSWRYLQRRTEKRCRAGRQQNI